MKYLFILLLTSSLFSDDINFETLFQKQKSSFKYLDIKNPPFIVLFSGTPGMGKSTISKALENDFKAIRFSSDETRAFFREEGVSLTYLEPYISFVLRKLKEVSRNRFIVLDRSIDRTFESLMSYCEETSSPYFLIKLIVPKEIVKERIINRDPNPNTLNILDRCWEDYEMFGANHDFDYIFDNTEDPICLDPLKTAIASHISLTDPSYEPPLRNEAL